MFSLSIVVQHFVMLDIIEIPEIFPEIHTISSNHKLHIHCSSGFLTINSCNR